MIVSSVSSWFPLPSDSEAQVGQAVHQRPKLSALLLEPMHRSKFVDRLTNRGLANSTWRSAPAGSWTSANGIKSTLTARVFAVGHTWQIGGHELQQSNSGVHMKKGPAKHQPGFCIGSQKRGPYKATLTGNGNPRYRISSPGLFPFNLG